ncbi:MAG: hypothetical protein IRY90_07495 [Actinomadura rubrobrunea]|nr:hypothetical protein [Actinomadura rubrobrunea]
MLEKCWNSSRHICDLPRTRHIASHPPRHRLTMMGRYGEVAEGASVEVRDEAGRVLGVARLGVGTVDGLRKDVWGTTAERCVFLIHAKAVPEQRVCRVVAGRQAPVTVDADQIGQVTVRLGG